MVIYTRVSVGNCVGVVSLSFFVNSQKPNDEFGFEFSGLTSHLQGIFHDIGWAKNFFLKWPPPVRKLKGSSLLAIWNVELSANTGHISWLG